MLLPSHLAAGCRDRSRESILQHGAASSR